MLAFLSFVVFAVIIYLVYRNDKKTQAKKTQAIETEIYNLKAELTNKTKKQ